MTVTATTDYSGPFAPDGVTAVFPFSFVALSTDEVVVLRMSALGAQTILTGGYTVALVDGGGGTVTFGVAPTAGDPLYIVSNPNFEQQATLSNQGAFSPKAINAAFDRAAVRDIALNAALARAALAPPTETLGVLPPAATRAGKYFAFDANGLATASSGTGNDAALRADLAASSGAGLLGWIAAGVGAVVRSILDKLRESVSAVDYGAKGDGVTDDGPAIMAAFNAGNKRVKLTGANNYKSAMQIVVPSYGKLILDDGTVLTKAFNGDLIDLSAQRARIKGGTILGQGGTYSGRGFVINAGASSYDQRIDDCDFLDFSGYCGEFVAADAGQRFRATNSNFCRTTVTNPAIKMPGASAEDILAGNRTFTNCGTISGGQLFDLDGAANSGIVNSLMVSILTGAKTSRSRFVANRVAIGGGTQVLDGYDNVFLGNVVAGNLQLAPTSQRCVVGPNSLIAGGTITDLSTATGSNMNYIYDAQGFSFTPVLGQTSGTGPTLGNGTATGRKYQNGRLVTVMVDVQFGSTSTFGDAVGDITVAMPAPHNRTAAFPAQSMAIATIGGVNTVGAVQIAQGDNKFTIVNNGGTTGWKQGQPGTFTASSRIRFTITYEQG